MLGFLSGFPILFACLALIRARRAHDRFSQRLAWIAVVVAVAAGAFAVWMWQYFLWDMHYHPGGGGAIPPPTTGELAFMPLIAAGLVLVPLGLILALRYFLGRRAAHQRTA